MPNVINKEGLNRIRYQDLRAEKAEHFKDEFGENIKTDVQSGFGQMISLATKSENDLITHIQSMLTAFDPYAAQGVWLSRLAILMNKRRNPEVKSTGVIDITVGSLGASIPVGFTVSNSEGYQFRTTLAETISANSTFSVPIEAIESGKIVSAPNSLVEIDTPTSGVISVTNSQAISEGRDLETDGELRVRCLNTSSALTSTLIGIDTAIREVDGVTFVRLYENNNSTSFVNPELPVGLPAHHVFPVIEGGNNLEIAKALVKTVAGGIDMAKPADNLVGVSNIISSSYTNPISGQTHLGYWSRPEPLVIHVEIKVVPSYGYPPDGATQIKRNLENWANENAQIGEIFYASDLYCPTYLLGNLSIDSLKIGLSSQTLGSQVPVSVVGKPVLYSANINVIEL